MGKPQKMYVWKCAGLWYAREGHSGEIYVVKLCLKHRVSTCNKNVRLFKLKQCQFMTMDFCIRLTNIFFSGLLKKFIVH